MDKKEYIDLDTPLELRVAYGNGIKPYSSTLRELLDFNHIPYSVADVRPVVTCANCEHNNACLTQAFVEDCGKIPLDRNTFFCADGERKSNA